MYSFPASFVTASSPVTVLRGAIPTLLQDSDFVRIYVRGKILRQRKLPAHSASLGSSRGTENETQRSKGSISRQTLERYSKGLFEFHGAAHPRDFNIYFNCRSEVCGLMRYWFYNDSVEVPNDPELEGDLTGPEYGFSSKNQIQVERKEDMKRRGLASPDLDDCLAMTFAVDISCRSQPTSQLVYPFPGPNAWAGYTECVPAIEVT